ncbi:MAG: Asp-tRNA(Asn)/Glu-tRNA(Gln) amidotransferase subunit GatC [Anaerolineales bacterium]|nr:Asp-tRNA(Asn)/Glu-tRNA(Gln) amidotransferase subunit GatC [Anaerolineales bacterium]
MALSRAEVQHIAELAKLHLTDAEIDAYTEQLSAILDYALELNSLDTDAIPPTASVLPLQNVMADDVVQPTLDRATLLRNAPDSEAGQIRVKAILE